MSSISFLFDGEENIISVGTFKGEIYIISEKEEKVINYKPNALEDLISKVELFGYKC